MVGQFLRRAIVYAMMDSARAVFLLSGLLAALVTATPRPNIIVVVADEYVRPIPSAAAPILVICDSHPLPSPTHTCNVP